MVPVKFCIKLKYYPGLKLTKVQKIEIRKIEVRVGRIPESKKNMPRILDIDILAIGDLQIQSVSLEIPHPGIFERKFVLKPWNDIAPEFTLPSSSATVSDLLVNTTDSSEVRMVLVLDKEGMI